LSAGALETTTTVTPIWLRLIIWAIGRGPRALLLRVALSRALAADGVGRGELAVSAAIFIRIIADGIILKFTSRWIAASIVAAACCPTAIALLVSLNNPIAASLTRKESHTSVVAETLSFHTVHSHCRAYVPDRTRGEYFDIFASGWVHDEGTAGIAGVCV